MDKKKEVPQEDITAPAQKNEEAVGAPDCAGETGKTEVKNAHASGLGAMGRSDESLLQKDEGENNY